MAEGTLQDFRRETNARCHTIMANGYGLNTLTAVGVPSVTWSAEDRTQLV